MITLFTSGRALGLPDLSPFAVKAEVLLKMARVPYKIDTTGFHRAPKGKIPYIEENGKKLGDSTFIRFYLESQYGANFDVGLSAEDKAIAWAFEKMCEDHLYWALMDMRWLDDENFYAGPAAFFASVPFFIRPMVVKMVRGKVRKAIYAHGLGRHTDAEIELLAARDLESLSVFLGHKKYFMGARPCGVDAAIFAFVSGALCSGFKGNIQQTCARYANLRSYSERMMTEYFPDLAGASSAKGTDGGEGFAGVSARA